MFVPHAIIFIWMIAVVAEEKEKTKRTKYWQIHQHGNKLSNEEYSTGFAGEQFSS